VSTRNASTLTMGFYLDDALMATGGGVNPFPTATHTTSNYLVLAGQAGDKICLSSSDGSMNIIKQLGVIAP